MITCTFEDGGSALLRHVTVNAIVTDGKQVLLGKRGTYHGGKPMLEAGKWGLIGGFIGRDEDLHQALKREVKEETGWEISNLTLFHIKDNPDRPGEDRQIIEFVFIVEGHGGDFVKDEEVSSLEWFPIDQLPPQPQIAFDHGDDLELYRIFLKQPFALPMLGKYNRA